MTRRDILTAAELTMAASALTATTYGLVVASYDPYAAVHWVPIAAMCLGTATGIVGLVALLFGGRLALLLAAEVFQGRRAAATPPPSARTPLWPRSAVDDTFAAYEAEYGTPHRPARHGGRR